MTFELSINKYQQTMILGLKFKKVFFREKRTMCEELLCETNYEKLSYKFFLPKSVLGPECTQQREKKKDIF